MSRHGYPADLQASSNLSREAKAFLASFGFKGRDLPELLDSRVMAMAEASARLQRKVSAFDHEAAASWMMISGMSQKGSGASAE